MAVLRAQPHRDQLWVIKTQPFQGAPADELYQICSLVGTVVEPLMTASHWIVVPRFVPTGAEPRSLSCILRYLPFLFDLETQRRSLLQGTSHRSTSIDQLGYKVL